MDFGSFLYIGRPLPREDAVHHGVLIRHQVAWDAVLLPLVCRLLVGGQVLLHVNHQHGSLQLHGSPDDI